MLTIDPHTPDNVVVGHASGKLTHEDYQGFRGRIEQMIRQHGSVRVLLDLQDFHGWDLQAAWDDLKLGLRFPGKFERCAILGDKKWEEWMIRLAKPFFRVKFFDRSERESAWRWLMQPATQHEPGLAEDIFGHLRRHPIIGLLILAGLVGFIARQIRSSGGKA